MLLLDAENTPWVLVAFKISSRKINTYGFVSSQTFFLLGKLRYLVQNPWFFWPPCEDDSDPHPCDTFFRAPGGWPARSWTDATCWDLLILWRAMHLGGTMHLDLEGSITPQGGWGKEEGKGHQKSLPLHMTSTHLVRGWRLQREPSPCRSARLSSVTIFCWKMVSRL